MKRVFTILLCVVAAFLVVRTFVWPRSNPRPQLVLPSGDSVVLVRLTCGTNHLAPKPKGWPLPRFARSLLLRPFGVNPEFRNFSTAEPSLVLWLEHKPGKMPAAPTGLTQLMLADESGHAAGKKIPYSGSSMRRNSIVAFPLWPRSSQHLTIRWDEGMRPYFGQSNSKLLGEWTVLNPAYQPPASWVPEPLPLTRTNGSLQCTLEHAFFGLDTPPRRDTEAHTLTFELAGVGEESAVVLVPRITSASPGETWETERVVLRDVSGNEIIREHLWLSKGETYCSFAPALWPAGAWEVNIFAKRQVPFQLPVSESFSPEELVIFMNVELRGSGQTTLDQELESSGARLRLLQFTLRPPQNLNEPWSREEASELRVILSQNAHPQAHVNLAGVTDDLGNPHYPRAHGYSTRGVSRDLDLNYSFPTLPLDTQKLTITFVVQRGREFTFHVKPEIPLSRVTLSSKLPAHSR